MLSMCHLEEQSHGPAGSSQAEKTRVMGRQGHNQQRQYPEETTENPSVCCLLESTWKIAFCKVRFSFFLPSK